MLEKKFKKKRERKGKNIEIISIRIDNLQKLVVLLPECLKEM